jgi:quercetin dioxygenase-like cupin family protein
MAGTGRLAGVSAGVEHVAEPEADLVEWREGVRTRLHAAASTGAAQLCVIEQWAEPGAGAPLHTHFEVEEAILVAEGEAEFTVDGETRRVASGESMLFPAHSWHGFRNCGAGELHIVAVFAAAAPPVEYETEPGVVYAIGGVGDVRRDAHRAVGRRPATS